MEVLRKHGLYQNAVIAIAADHGEAFGEHGEVRHGMFLYDETIHVPLLLKLPTGRLGGKHFEDQLALAAVAPTLLEVAGIPAPATMQAKSLFPMIEEAKIDKTKFVETDKGKMKERPIYSETNYAHRAFGWSELRSWRTGKYLYVQAPKRELYDQSSDPDAGKNLVPAAKAVADTLPDRRRRPIAKSTLRQSPRNVRSTGPVRSELARACRIALMEATESVSVETIYDRIERRESFSFVGYKHPFRAIVLAMSAMVKRGEAILLSEAGHRRWR